MALGISITVYLSSIGIEKTHLSTIKDGFFSYRCIGESPHKSSVEYWLKCYQEMRTPPRLDVTLVWPEKQSSFRRRVLEAIREIPYGQVLSYKEIAEIIGHARAFRAVGSACGENSFPLIIPCHRVIAANGKIGGFSLDPRIKERLLSIEEEANQSSI